jgi:diaminopimelate decarboxylase
VTVRLGGFGIESGSCSVSDGLFGVSVTEIGSLLDYLVAHRTRVDLKGFSYHFNSDSLDFRALATARTIKAVLQARERGLSPSIVNIGGGLRIAYAECAEEWKQFLVDMKQSVTGRGPGVSWNRTGLGFRLEGERVTGSLQVVEHFTRGEPAEQLEALLETRLPSFGELPTAQVLDELGLELHIEPGRALLDQAGVTIGEVAFIKASEQGQQLVGLRMNRTNLNAHELTILTDPIPVGPARVGDPVGVFLMGNTCIANELLCPRKVWLPALPRPGSLLAFVNTAAYSMDFGESYVLHHRVAEKVAVRESKEEKFIWFRDSDYVPSILEVIHAR